MQAIDVKFSQDLTHGVYVLGAFGKIQQMPKRLPHHEIFHRDENPVEQDQRTEDLEWPLNNCLGVK